MKRFAVIGLGTFGSNVARSLYEKGHEVIVLDASDALVQKAKDFATVAVAADATDRDFLESFGFREVDCAVVSVGDRIDASILITLHLAELGISKIVVKAVNEIHGRILKRIGATEVVHPEKEMALRLADRISHSGVLDQIALEDGFSILETRAPECYVGIPLKDSRIRQQYALNVIAVRPSRQEKQGRRAFSLPKPDYSLETGDVLVLFGEDEQIEKFKELP